MISAVVLTKNEEKNLGQCLESLDWCDEIIVIDDFSTDKTLEIARKKRALVFQRKLNDDFSGQRNFALSKAKGEWVFFLDADEIVPESLKIEILNYFSSKKKDNTKGFYFRRKDFFLGGWLSHGETASVRLLRLAALGAGSWHGKVDETWQISGRTGEFKTPLLHYSHETLAEFLKSLNYYSTLNAERLERLNFFDWFKPPAKFLLNFFIRLGFLDGVRGFIFAVLMSFHSFLVRGKQFLWLKKDCKNG